MENMERLNWGIGKVEDKIASQERLVVCFSSVKD